MLNSRPVNGVPCKFRTCYDLTFWPVEVAEAEWKTPDRLQPPIKSSDAVAAVRIDLRCTGDMTFSQAVAQLAALLPERRKQHGALRSTSCSRTTACRSWCAIPSRGPRCSRCICRRRRCGRWDSPKTRACCPIRGARSWATGCCRNTSAFPQKFFFLDLTGLEQRVPRRLRGARRGHFADLALRAQRPPADARAGRFRQDVSLGMHAHREPVCADRRAHPAGAHALRIPGGSRREPAPGHRSLRDHRGGERQPADAGSRCISSRCIRSATPGQVEGAGLLARRAAAPPAIATTKARKSSSRWWTSRRVR